MLGILMYSPETSQEELSFINAFLLDNGHPKNFIKSGKIKITQCHKEDIIPFDNAQKDEQWGILR